MIDKLIEFDKTLSSKDRIPYNTMYSPVMCVVEFSSDYKNVSVFQIETSNILNEFSGGRTVNPAPKLGIDNESYVFGFGENAKVEERHNNYMEKLSENTHIIYLKEVYDFIKYVDSHKKVRDKIKNLFKEYIPNYEKGDFKSQVITFKLENLDHRLDEDKEFIKLLSKKPKHSDTTICALCGTNNYPVQGILSPKVPFGKNTPSLAAYNFKNVETASKYGIDPGTKKTTTFSKQGGVCSGCYHKAYSALKYLLNNTVIESVKRGEKVDIISVYTNRINFKVSKYVTDIVVFFTSSNNSVPELYGAIHGAEGFFTGVVDKKTIKDMIYNAHKGGKLLNRKEALDDDEYYIFTTRDEKGAFMMFYPNIGKVSTLRNNLYKWEDDVVYIAGDGWDDVNNRYTKSKQVLPPIYKLSNGLKNIYGAYKILFECAIDNKPLDYRYIDEIVNNYLYDEYVKQNITYGLIKLIFRRSNMVDEQYQTIGRLFSLLKSVRQVAQSTGYDKFESQYLPSILRMPSKVLTQLLEENSHHILSLLNEDKTHKRGTYLNNEIKKLGGSIDLSSIRLVSTPQQRANIMEGFLKNEKAQF